MKDAVGSSRTDAVPEPTRFKKAAGIAYDTYEWESASHVMKSVHLIDGTGTVRYRICEKAADGCMGHRVQFLYDTTG